MHDPFVSVDFETYYDKEYSLSEMSTWEYVFHEKFDAYMVAVYCEDIKFVGHPNTFDWSQLSGRTVIHHNASFDGLVIKRLQKDGVIPADLKLAGAVDTADLAAYLKVMRNLKSASKYLLGLEISKAAREGAKGKKSSELVDDQTMLDYALSDAKNAYDIWMAHSNKWSEDERLISSWNREAGWKGVYVDQEYLDWAIEQISNIRFEAEKLIPWKNWRETHKTPLSAAKIRLGCRDAGIPCPSSFAKDSEECEEWEDKFGPKFPWIAALRDWRRSNTFLTKLLTIRQRVRDDGTMPYGIKYFGAHSGRMSSDGGVNLLNLEKFPKFADLVAPYKNETKRGVDIRRVFIARPGKVLYLADLAQIEARVINLLCGNFAFLEACKTMSPYEAHARTSMGWKGGDLKKENPKLYALAKARVLALGYQAGYKKFIFMMRLYGIKPEEIFTEDPTYVQVDEFKNWLAMCEKEEDLAEFDAASQIEKRVMVGAWLQVQDFRLNNPLLRGLWNMMDQGIKTAASHKENFDIRMPSGRIMSYIKPFTRDNQTMAWVVRGDKPKHFYGGKIVENCLTENAEVLTNSGWKRIADVLDTDLVHDGVDFVIHGGVVFKSIQPCIEVDGVGMTKDHEVLTHEGWKAALENPRPYRPSLRELEDHADNGERREETVLGVSLPLWEAGGEGGVGRHQGDKTGWDSKLWLPYAAADRQGEHVARNVEAPGLRGVAEHERQMQATHASGVGELRWSGNNGLRSLAAFVRKLLGRHGADVQNRADAGSRGQQQGVLSRELSVGNLYGQHAQHQSGEDAGMGLGRIGKERSQTFDAVLPGGQRVAPGTGGEDISGLPQPVYDILDCGPRHRFVVKGDSGPFIVHNCCQALARDYFVAGQCRLLRAGFEILWTVYDEYVIECDTEKDYTAEIAAIVRDTPDWGKACPIDVEINKSHCYTK